MASESKSGKLTLADLLPHSGLLPRDAVKMLSETAAAADQFTAAAGALSEAIKPLAKTLEVEQYAKRDATWQAYYVEHDLRNRGHNSMVVASMHDAFNAGWAARKKIDYEMAWGLDKSKAE